jgi:hypothetical protein
MVQSPEQDQFCLEAIADKARALGMSEPLRWFLELHRPLGSVLANTMLIFEPLIAMFAGQQFSKTLTQTLSDPEAMSKLCTLLDAPVPSRESPQ